MMTLGNVTVNPAGSSPARSTIPVTNPSRVRSERAGSPSANDFTRSPHRRGSVPASRIPASASTACSTWPSSSSGRTPYPSSKSTRRSSTGSVASLRSTLSCTAVARTAGSPKTSASSPGPLRCALARASASSPHAATVPAPNRSAGTYTVCTGCQAGSAPG